jgi:hypothetical protein
MTIKKLNTKGFAHWILPVLVVGVIAAIGTYVITSSHAEKCVTTSVPCTNIRAVSSEWVGKPDLMTSTQTGPYSTALAWSYLNNSGKVAGYNIYSYIVGKGRSTASLVNHGGKSQFVNVTGLQPNTTYAFFIKAYDSTVPPNLSPASNIFKVTTQPTITAPTNFEASLITSNTFFYNFTPSTVVGNLSGINVAGYEVFRYKTNQGLNAAVLYARTGTNTSGSIAGLSPNTKYSFYVKAFDSATPAGFSAQSNTVKVTTTP